jgi:hypothetical protein
LIVVLNEMAALRISFGLQATVTIFGKWPAWMRTNSSLLIYLFIFVKTYFPKAWMQVFWVQ